MLIDSEGFICYDEAMESCAVAWASVIEFWYLWNRSSRLDMDCFQGFRTRMEFSSLHIWTWNWDASNLKVMELTRSRESYKIEMNRYEGIVCVGLLRELISTLAKLRRSKNLSCKINRTDVRRFCMSRTNYYSAVIQAEDHHTSLSNSRIHIVESCVPPRT